MNVNLVLKDLKAYVNKTVMECCLAIKDGKIFKIGKEANMPKTEEKISLKGLLVLPGLIDVHVHLRDEGKSYKEDFYSGTAAAAAGGITTVLDMPNNSPVTMSAETLRNRMKTAERKILVNVGFYSEFPRNLQEIGEIIREGVVAFKLFMGEQVGGLNVDDDHAIKEAFKNVGIKVPVAVHAEDKETLKSAEKELRLKGCNDVEAFLKAHSEEAEVKAVKRVIAIAKETGVRVHFCHVSSEKSLKAVVEAKKAMLPISCEVTPHHLLLSVEDLKRIGCLALNVPPVREKNHVDFLWKGVKEGWVDIIASDHAPHAIEEKSADAVWNVKVGIPGLETTLPLLLNEVNNGRLTIADVVKLMAENPAKIFNLKGRGSLKEGNKADLVAVDLKKEHRINAPKFHSKAKYSPFNGMQVKGKPLKTFVNGKLVMDNDEIVAEAGSGEIIEGG
ncbi:MAG: dihydroorotase family protein [Candidatus Bathyarchaeia archaeon]